MLIKAAAAADEDEDELQLFVWPVAERAWHDKKQKQES